MGSNFPSYNLNGFFPGRQFYSGQSQAVPSQARNLNQAFANFPLSNQPQLSVMPLTATGMTGINTGKFTPAFSGPSAGSFDTVDSGLSTLLATLALSLMSLLTKLSGSTGKSKAKDPGLDETGENAAGDKQKNPSPLPPSQETKPGGSKSDTKPNVEKKDDPPPPGNNSTPRTEKVNGGGPNEMVLKNTDSKPMTIGLFENTGPGLSPNLGDPNYKFTLQPGETLKVAMPENWQGRAQKIGGNPLDPASWAEINYSPENGGNRLWYNLSLIRGYNSAVTLRPTSATDDSQLAGSTKSIIDGAPPDAVTIDAGGNKVIKDTETFTGTTNQASIDYLNKAVGNKAAYVRFNDDGAVRTTTDRSLTVTFGAA